MLKATLVIAAVATALSLTPAIAQDMKCDEATMSSMNTKVMGMKDQAMMKEAQNHMALAKTSMESKKMDDCMMHMKEAQKSMGNM